MRRMTQFITHEERYSNRTIPYEKASNIVNAIIPALPRSILPISG